MKSNLGLYYSTLMLMFLVSFQIKIFLRCVGPKLHGIMHWEKMVSEFLCNTIESAVLSFKTKKICQICLTCPKIDIPISRGSKDNRIICSKRLGGCHKFCPNNFTFLELDRLFVQPSYTTILLHKDALHQISYDLLQTIDMEFSQRGDINLQKEIDMIYMSSKSILNLIVKLTQRHEEVSVPNGLIDPSSGASLKLMSGDSTELVSGGSNVHLSGSSKKLVLGSSFERGLLSISSGVIGMQRIWQFCCDAMIFFSI